VDKLAIIDENLYYDERSAGGIVYRIDGDKVMFLLIKTFANKRHKTVFKFPKGHLNRGEVLKQAATREVEEEGRVKSEIVTKIGSNDYIIWDKLKKKKIIKKVTFFLMRYAGESNVKYYDSEVVLERVWLEFDEALEKLAYDSEKVLLKKAKWKLEEMLKK
jgi:ADP-ribose pyrophosphatase YjhB (NUDIX family)